jgi:hypothetical protein
VLSMLEMQVSPYACYCLSLLRGWCVVYVGDASVSLRLLLFVSSSWLVCCLCWRCNCHLTPVIACLFFVAGVLSMLEMQVSPYTCYCLSLLRGWCCLCWRCKCHLSSCSIYFHIYYFFFHTIHTKIRRPICSTN